MALDILAGTTEFDSFQIEKKNKSTTKILQCLFQIIAKKVEKRDWVAAIHLIVNSHKKVHSKSICIYLGCNQ